jgi:hypothetical protein
MTLDLSAILGMKAATDVSLSLSARKPYILKRRPSFTHDAAKTFGSPIRVGSAAMLR